MKDRTLDQQCTVTRIGTSAIAGALAVELLVSLLHHPKKGMAPASTLQDKLEFDDFGMVPHQIRGSLANYQHTLLYGQNYNQCTACSQKVIITKYGNNYRE